MKRNLTLLAALLLLAAALCLCSCDNGSKDSGAETSADTAVPQITVNITDFTIIRQDEASKSLIQDIVSFRKELNSKLTKEVGIGTDWSKEGLTDTLINANEILIGQTNRPQSEEALAQLTETTSFIIKVTQNKIVINSACDAGTSAGLEYLLGLVTGDTLTVDEGFTYISDPIPSIDIIKDGKSEFKIVYHDGLDATAVSTDEKDLTDPEVTYSKELRQLIGDKTGVKIDLGTDWRKTGEDKSALFEILIGDEIDRPETEEFLASIAYNEYGYAVIGNKVVVTGWNLTTTALAYSMFKEDIKSAIVTNSDGTKGLNLLSSVRRTGTYTDYKWYLDFPEYGAPVSGTFDSGYGDLVFLYNDTTKEMFTSYTEALAKNGFVKAQENDIAGNLSATFTSDKGMLHIYYVPYDKTTRIVTTPKGNYNLPDANTASEVAAFTKVTSTKITQMAFNYTAGNFGMCYILTLQDGSFVVFDGGGYSDSYGDTARLYNNLKNLNKRPDGKIVIAAWIVTHEHWDHVTNFINMCKTYGSNITIETCYMNTAAKSSTLNCNNPNYYILSGFTSLQNAVNGPCKMVQVHTGMKFYVRNLEFEVLFTEEDIYPKRMNYFNETSVIYRMTAEGQTVMWLGDNKNNGSATMINRYKSYVNCDICQVSHHGYDGTTIAAYTLLNPKQVYLWPTSASSYANLTAGTNTSSYFAVDLFVKNQVGAANIIVAEPTKTITLPFVRGNEIVTEPY